MSAAVRECARLCVRNVLLRYPAVAALDIETTGMRATDVAISVALVSINSDGAVVSDVSGLIPPPFGIAVHPQARRIHGITDERIAREQHEPVAFLHSVVDAIDHAHDHAIPVVAHNRQFDVRHLNTTLRSHGVARAIDEERVFCTMKHSKRQKRWHTRDGRAKQPTNTELYETLHGCVDDTLCVHDARDDALMTARSYVAGRRRAWW